MSSTDRTSILLGTREPETYGHATLADVETLCAATAAQFGLTADCRQSNHEGELIDFIHEAKAKGAIGIVINAGGYSHTSIALHDALVGGQDPHRRGAHQQHLRARGLPSSLFHGQGRVCDALRLWHRRLSPRDIRPCRPHRRQGQSLTPPPATKQESFGSTSWRASQTKKPLHSFPATTARSFASLRCCSTRPA